MEKREALKAALTFVHKIRVVFKELNETSIWLRIIERSQMLSKEQLLDLIQENGDLCKIFAASLRTTRAVTK
jgi:four helix bundle protein